MNLQYCDFFVLDYTSRLGLILLLAAYVRQTLLFSGTYMMKYYWTIFPTVLLGGSDIIRIYRHSN